MVWRATAELGASVDDVAQDEGTLAECPEWFTCFIDYALPLLTPYQAVVYLLLLRRSAPEGTHRSVRIGKRTIASALGKGTRSSQGNYEHIAEKLNELAALGCIEVGGTTREGTHYLVRVPSRIPAVQELLTTIRPQPRRDYYRDPGLRVELFERDDWRCRYCGDALSTATATLDHITPAAKGGSNDAENLATCCLPCNSIKSGRTYAEAAPRLLEALRARRQREPSVHS